MKTDGSGETETVEASRWESLREALAPPMLKRSLAVACVIGAMLNAINQGDLLLVGAGVDWLKIWLTFVVPFGVSTYGAYAARRLRDPAGADPRPTGSSERQPRG